MHPKACLRQMWVGVVALATVTASLQAQPMPPAGGPDTAPPPDVRIDAKTGALIVPLGGVVRFEPPQKKPIRDVINRNEDILDARIDIRTPTALVLVGRVPGVSRITLVFGTKDNETKVVYDVIVQPDYELLKNVIRRAMPTANVDIIPGAGNAIILTGFVSKPEDSDTIQRIASDTAGGNVQNIINALQVGGSQHVLIDLTIAQVDRSEIRERGVSFGVSGPSGTFISVLGGVATNATGGAVGAATSGGISVGSANLVVGIVPAGFLGAMRALRTEGIAKFLSEPKLVTQTGRPAFFRAGGQQAILSAASGINGPGAQLQAVGTTVEVLPIVYGNGKIYLEVNPNITSVNNARGIATAFGFTPGFNEQQTRSSVMLESGQTFAIGGLIENTVQATSERVPFIGDLPVIGTLFSRQLHEEREDELVVLVTPRLVEPMDCGQTPRRVPGKETRSPDDYELFVETLLEAPRGQRRPWTREHGYQAPYKSDPTYGKYPCIGGVCAPGGVYSAPGSGLTNSVNGSAVYSSTPVNPVPNLATLTNSEPVSPVPTYTAPVAAAPVAPITEIQQAAVSAPRTPEPTPAPVAAPVVPSPLEVPMLTPVVPSPSVSPASLAPSAPIMVPALPSASGTGAAAPVVPIQLPVSPLPQR